MAMAGDGADPWEPWPDGAARSSSLSRAVHVDRGWPHSRVRSPARTRPWLRPRRPTSFAAYGRAEGGSHVRERWTRDRRGLEGVDGAARDEADAGGNAAGDLVGDGAEGFSAGGVAREARGSGGGVCGFGWKRRLPPHASPPTPKRRDVSSTRRFPPLYGRESAAPLRSVRSGGDDGLRVGASPSHGGFGSEERGWRPAPLEKVVGARGGASAADWYPHGHKAMVGKEASHASLGSAGLMEIKGAGGFFGARSGQLGKKRLESLPAVGSLDALAPAHDSGSLAYGQSATQTVGTVMNDGAAECQELEEGEIADTMEIAEGMIKNEIAASKPMEGQELEDGEIADTIDAVEAMNEDLLDGPVDGQELEEGEIAASATMVIVGAMNKDTFYGSSVEDQELEEGEIAPHMDTAEAMNEGTLDGAVEVQELGEISATMGIGESANKESSDRAVEVKGLEGGVISATMDIVESMNTQSLDGVAVVQGLEQSEIAAMDIVEGTNKDTFVRPAEDRELEGEIAAKGHGQEPDDGEIATESDHIVQQSVNGIPHGSISGIMRSKIRFTARKAVRPPVNASHMSQLVPLDRPYVNTIAAMKKFKAAEAKPVPVSVASSSASFTPKKKFKAADTKPVPISLASTSALASKENRKFKPLFITKEKLKGKRAAYLDDDDILKALAVHEGKLEVCLSVDPRSRQHGGQNADPRSRVRMMCRRFEFLCRFLAQAVKQGSIQLRRVDLAADQLIKGLPDYIKQGSIVGEVAGVEVGDEFLFRVELAIVGLHSPYRAGIDTTKDTDGELIAVSIIASGGYLDEFSSSGELVYTGSGGKAAGSDHDGDQKLQRGNLALRNCIIRKIPVRVTHGFKSQNREEGSHSIGKEISKFIYDGLYHVVGFWPEGIPGSRVFKYRLRRIPGQPQLPLDVAKWLRKSVVHPR